MADPIHQWLGHSRRRTLWRVTPDTPEASGSALCLGYIKPEGNGWAAYVPTEPGPGVPMKPNCLRWLDDAEAAAKTMCAYWRVPYLPLEPEEVPGA